MSHYLKQISNLLFIIAHFPVLLVAAALEYFSDSKMGVYRYLVYKNRVFEASLFTKGMVTVYQYLLAAGVILGLILLLWNIFKGGKKEIRQQEALFLLANAIGLYFIFFVSPGQLAAYYFFLMGILVVVTLRFLRLVVTGLRSVPSK